jgi:hypothetical protein
MKDAPYEVDDRGLGDTDCCGGVAADGCADDGEDARADDDSDAEGGERDGAEGFLEGVLGTLGVGDELVDGFGCEDLAGQGEVLVAGIYRVVTIVSAGMFRWRD